MFLKDFAHLLKGNTIKMKRSVEETLQKRIELLRTPDALLSVLNAILILLDLKFDQFSLAVSNLSFQNRANKQLQISCTEFESYLEPFVGKSFIEHFTSDFYVNSMQCGMQATAPQ